MRKPMLIALLTLVSLLMVPHAGAHGEHISGDVAGTFSTTCGAPSASHHAKDDPIVYPGQPGASHDHEFFGNNSTNAFSTYSSMTAATTDCNFKGDTAGYWVPTLLRPDGTRLTAYNHWVYIRDYDCTTYGAYCNWGQEMVPFPPGLKIITGGTGTPIGQAHWRCKVNGVGVDSKRLLNCDAGSYLTFEVQFPECWDGVNLDSPDHRSHLTYNKVTVNGVKFCPASHPVRLPGLSVFGLWIPDGLDALRLGYRLSSDTGTQQGESLHADFWNTWNQSELERVTTTCLINHQDIPESPNTTINGVQYDPSCLQADSKFVTTTTTTSPTPTPSPAPAPSPSPSPTVSAFCLRHPDHWKCL